MTLPPETIAIDGPAASGKSTVGHRLAQRLDYLFFDTGAMYRALTFLAIERGLPLDDNAALGQLAESVPIEIIPPEGGVEDGRQYTVMVEGRDITWDIRHHLVDRHVSQVSAHAAVRAALSAQQRRIGQRGRVVMVGRDIGTVVMPDAPLKVYLSASIEERARRRHRELEARGVASRYDELLGAMRARDRIDSSRAEAPLRAAADALRIESDGLEIDAVVERLYRLWCERCAPRAPADAPPTAPSP